MNNKLAVTGAAGKSGRVFMNLLKENSNKINEMFPGGINLMLHSNSAEEEGLDKFNSVEKFYGKLEDESYLTKSLTGVDTLVHISGIHWSKEVVDAAAKCNVRRMIMVHTTGIYSKYKEAGEEYRLIDDHVYNVCRKKGIVLTILRPTMIYGCVADKNVVTFIKMVDKLPIMPVVSGARFGLQPVHYRDLGWAYYEVLMNEEVCGNHDYVLSGGALIELRDMLKVIADNLSKKIHFFSVPYPIAIFGANALYYLSGKRKDFREKVKRLVEPRVYGHEDAAKDFGYNPVTFSEGIVDEVREYIESR